MRTFVIEDSYIDLDKVANSGQCFRWHRPTQEQIEVFDIDIDGWVVPVLDDIVFLKRIDRYHIEVSCSLLGEDVIRAYLGLNHNYEEMFAVLENNASKEFSEAYEYGRGITILNQDLWETTISFLISQNNNIPRIKKTIGRICGGIDKPFPNAGDLLSELAEDDFGLGYRKPYIVELCKKYVSGNAKELTNMEHMSALWNIMNGKGNMSGEPDSPMSLDDVLSNLQSFAGIGPKVASCIALFSLGRIDCVPRDVWIKRAEEEYNVIWDKKYAGFQQQLIFFWQQQTKTRKAG